MPVIDFDSYAGAAAGSVTINAIGASLVLIRATSFNTTPITGFTDTQSNVYVPASLESIVGGARQQFFYCLAPTPHATLQITPADGAFMAYTACAVSGFDAFDAEPAGASGSGFSGSANAGSFSPVDGAAIFVGFGHESAAAMTATAGLAVDDPSWEMDFTGGVNFGGVLAWGVHTTGATDPGFTFTGTTSGGISAISFAPAVVATLPAGQRAQTLPQYRDGRAIDLRTHLQPTPLNLLGQDAMTTGDSYQFPAWLPRPSLTFPIALRSWTNNNLQNTLQADVQPDPFKSQAWALPIPPRHPAALLNWAQNLQQSTLAPAPTVNPFRTERFPLPTRVRYEALRYQWEQYYTIDENAPPAGAVDEVPSGPRYPIGLRTWTQNLLQSTLAPSQVVNPFVNLPVQNPRGPARAVSLLSWESHFTTTTDRPAPQPVLDVPRGPSYPVELRTWLQALLQSTLTPPQSTQPFFNAPVPNPLGYAFPLDLRTWTVSQRLADPDQVPLPVFFVPYGPSRSISLLTLADDGRLCLRGGGTPTTGGGIFNINHLVGAGL